MAGWHRVGHRGAPREFAANTMRGFRRALEWGCTMVECDIRQAADGVLVLAHDPQVTDAQGVSHVIAEKTSVQLHALDLGVGEGVPTLKELAEWAQGHGAIMADMKCEGGDVEHRVVETLAALPRERKLVPGAGEASRARFRALDPTLPLSLSLGYDHLDNAEFESLLHTIDTEAVTWQWSMLTPERIARLQERGLRVFAWTVDNAERMRALHAAGVDGIISNRPDLLAELPESP